MRGAAGLWLVAAGLAIAGCGGDESAPVPVSPAQGGPQHIHGLGINPRDGSLFIATHTGVFRAPRGSTRSRRIADRWQDTMGFSVVGPDRFLGSGHPDVQDKLPPLLGLIRSDDAGRTWQSVSLMGKADFHVLRSTGRRVYGFDSTHNRLLVSDDGGKGWSRRPAPAPLIDLAIDPKDRDHVVAAGERAVFESRDAARGWRPVVENGAGLLAWTDALFLVDGAGTVHRSSDGGRSFEPVGEVGGQAAAFVARGRELYVALHDNAVKVSRDGGRSWQPRLPPS